VLVVDDDLYVRQLLVDMLVHEGFSVTPAESASGLTDLVRDQQPDVVILDEMMEPVSGLEALRSLRSSGEQVLVMMLTAVSPEDLLEAAVAVGADDYLAKPFSNAVLVAHLRAMLRRSGWQSGKK
jgi:DNA-binding response OmpR family regulator